MDISARADILNPHQNDGNEKVIAQNCSKECLNLFTLNIPEFYYDLLQWMRRGLITIHQKRINNRSNGLKEKLLQKRNTVSSAGNVFWDVKGIPPVDYLSEAYYVTLLDKLSSGKTTDEQKTCSTRIIHRTTNQSLPW